jgi:hypothetical protein
MWAQPVKQVLAIVVQSEAAVSQTKHSIAVRAVPG